MAIIDVRPGDDLVAAVNGTADGDIVNIHPGLDRPKAVYDIGTAALTPANNVRIQAPLPRMILVDPYRMVYKVLPWVEIKGSGWNIFDLSTKSGNVIEGLEISGARFDPADELMSGKAVRGGINQLVRLCWFHDNENNAIGAAWQGEMNFCYFTRNSVAAVEGISSATKTTQPCRIEHCLFEQNFKGGPWVDCDSTDFYMGYSIVRDDPSTGIFYEISQGPGLIEHCLVENCNTEGAGGRGGIVITSSKNVTVSNVVFKNNGHSNMRIWEDSRFQNGPNACASGYYLENVMVQDCSFVGEVGGPGPRIIFNGQSTIFVSQDSDYPNPHTSAPLGAQVGVHGLSEIDPSPEPAAWRMVDPSESFGSFGLTLPNTL